MKFLFTCLILSFGVVGVGAQGFSQSENDLAELRRRAQKVLAETPHRIKFTVEMRDSTDAEWEPYSYQVREVVPPDRSYLRQFTGLRLEVIKIGAATYQRSPGGDWKEVVPDGYTGGTVTQVRPPTYQTEEITDTVSGDSSAKKFRTNSQSTISLNRDGTIVDIKGTRNESFDESGRFVRIEYLHFNWERRRFQRNREEFEYDPTIRIEAPIK